MDLSNLELSYAPTWIKNLMMDVCSTPIENVLDSLARWRKEIAGLPTSEFASYISRVAGKLAGGTESPAAAILLTAVCYPLLKDDPEFTRHMYPLTLQAARALHGLPGGHSAKVRTQLIGRLRRLLLQPDQAEARLRAVFHAYSLSCDGTTVVFDHTVGVPLRDFLRRPDANLLEQLRSLCDQSSDPDTEHLKKSLTRFVTRNWPVIGPQLLEKWIEYAFSGNIYDLAKLEQMLAFYPPAPKDRAWLESGTQRFIEALDQRSREYMSAEQLRFLCQALDKFSVPGVSSRSLATVLVGVGPGSAESFRYEVILNHAWDYLDPEDTGLLLTLLWCEKQFHRYLLSGTFRKANERRAQISLRAQGLPHYQEAAWLVDRLMELPSHDGYYGSRRSELSPDELSAWRTEVLSTLRAFENLQQPATEFLLWCAEGLAADQAPMVLMSLLKRPHQMSHLQSLLRHIDRKVQRRAFALLQLLDASSVERSPEVDRPPTRSLADTISATNAAAITHGNAQTWIDDPRVERIISGAIMKAEQRFCIEYPSAWGHEEERLVSRLLFYLEEELRTAEDKLKDLTVHGMGSPIKISLRYRETTKHEEGQRTSTTAAHDVDVAFLLHAEEDGVVKADRACLLQVKKLSRVGREGPWESMLRIDSEQLDSLLQLSASTFYLFLVPGFDQEECWVMPAHLVRSMLTAGMKGSALQRSSAHRAHRSLSHWLTYDVIGLWMGDESKETRDRAEGNHPGRVPRFVVDVIIRKGMDDHQR